MHEDAKLFSSGEFEQHSIIPPTFTLPDVDGKMEGKSSKECSKIKINTVKLCYHSVRLRRNLVFDVNLHVWARRIKRPW